MDNRRKRQRVLHSSIPVSAPFPFQLEAAQHQQQVQVQVQLQQHSGLQHSITEETLAGHQLLQQLPEALLEHIVLQGGTQRHLHGVLAAVCQDWRRVLLQSTTQLAVGLTSAEGAASLATWLSRHAAGLQQLDMATVGLFGRHCDNATRLQLFQALHEAVGPSAGAAAAVAAATPPDPETAVDMEAAEADGPAAAAAAAVRGAATPIAAFGRLGLASTSQPDCSLRSSGSAPHAGSQGAGDEDVGSGDVDSEDVGSEDVGSAGGYSGGGWRHSSSDSEGLCDQPTPVCGGMLAGSDHIISPSPGGHLLSVAAAAASMDAEGAAGCHFPYAAAAAGDAGHDAAAAAAGPDSEEMPEQQATPQQSPQQQPQPQYLRLQRLSANMRLTPADCAAIASLPAPHLARLDLQGSRTRRLGIDGVRALAVMTQLTSLKMQQLGIGDEATALLAQGLTGLLQLSLSGNNIGPVGAAAIAQHCSKLEQLDLSINRLKGAGLVALCGALQHLTELHLAGNPRWEVTSLQQLQHLTNLSHLTISGCGLCNQGLAAIAAALPQLHSLDAANNKLSKVDPLTALAALTSLNLNRNPLQLNCAKVLSGLALQQLAVFDGAPARSIAHLSGHALTSHLTSLTLGADPSTNLEGSDEGLALAKTRVCSTLFGALGESGVLSVLLVPCAGLGDAQIKMVAKLGASLRHLNISHNCVTSTGLKALRELPLLERLELRAMRPELRDGVTANISSCTRLSYLDLAHNDMTSEEVQHLGCSALSRLQHLDLRNNAQVEKWAVMAAASHLTQLTHLNLLEISDVSARAFPRPTGAKSGSGAGGSGRAAAAAGAAGAAGGGGGGGGGPSPGSLKRAAAAAAAAAAEGASGAVQSPRTGHTVSGGGVRLSAAGVSSGGAAGRPHADVWAALPNLEELLVEGQYAANVGRGGRVIITNG